MQPQQQALSFFAIASYLILIHRSSGLLTRSSSSKQLHVEVFVVADHSMTLYHGDNLSPYLLTLMSTVALIYKDDSIGNAINVAVVKIHVLDKQETREIVYNSVSRTLRNFCRWQRAQLMGQEEGEESLFDVSILITRQDLCREPGSCDTLGLAQLGAVCDSRASCAVIEDNGLSAAFTIAHELAHVMNIPHDDAEKCASVAGLTAKSMDQMLAKSHPVTHSPNDHIMSRAMHYNSHPWTWSKCSKSYLTEFFDAGNGDCLLNQPKFNLLENYSPQVATGRIRPKKRLAFAAAAETRTMAQLAGELFDPDYQCKLVFGSMSKICPYMPTCRRLWCTIGSQGGCRTQHMPWADGTACAKSKWCQKGQCVSKFLAQDPKRDGGWGQWSALSPCSRSCGGGVQKTRRECDNPRPRNGGKYCVGHRVQYRSCNTVPCEAAATDGRDKQCAAFNGQDTGSTGLPVFPFWLPHTKDVAREDSCKLLCTVKGSSAYYTLADRVIDGTPCFPGSDDVCVNGKCYPAGCDRVLFSRTKRDICGVCGGDGSGCVTIRRSVRPTKLKYGYSALLILPVNTTSATIEHKKVKRRGESNYLAMRDDKGQYLLNGDFVISMYPKSVVVDDDGTIAQYSGSSADRETISIRDKVHRKVIIEILSVGTTSPLITYEYSVTKRIRSRAVRPTG